MNVFSEKSPRGLFRVKARVYCTFQQEGFHSYEEANESHSYLRDRHRHVFHFKVSVSVRHNNRDIEFIELKETLQKHFAEPMFINDQSCEQLAERAIEFVNTVYNEPDLIEVEVSEDGENGAIVTFENLNM